MAGCPFTRKPDLCARRQAWTTPAPSDCRECDFRGRKATADDPAPPRGDTKRPIPATVRPKPETITPPKEAPLKPEKMTTKDKVLGIITRRGAAGKTPLLQGSKASSDELKVIVGELEREGKVLSWPYRGRAGMMAIYTLPDAKDPRTPEMFTEKPLKPEKKKAPAKAPAPKASRRVNRRVNRSPRVFADPAPKVLQTPGSRVVGPGDNQFAAVIADLEVRRSTALDTVEKIDVALAGLRALV